MYNKVLKISNYGITFPRKSLKLAFIPKTRVVLKCPLNVNWPFKYYDKHIYSRINVLQTF